MELLPNHKQNTPFHKPVGHTLFSAFDKKGANYPPLVTHGKHSHTTVPASPDTRAPTIYKMKITFMNVKCIVTVKVVLY